MSQSRMTSEDRSVSVDELPAERYSAHEDDEIINRVRNRAGSTGKRLPFINDFPQDILDQFSPTKIARDNYYGNKNRMNSEDDNDDNRVFRSFSSGERLAPGTLIRPKSGFEGDIDPELLRGSESLFFRKQASEPQKEL